jgi:hypothetical protein
LEVADVEGVSLWQKTSRGEYLRLLEAVASAVDILAAAAMSEAVLEAKAAP